MKELREDGTIVYTGEGTISAIERKTKLAKVSIDVEGLRFAESGWWEIANVEPFNTGDHVTYEIVKAPDRDYRDITKLAPVEVRDQMATSKPTDSASGHDDAPGGGTPIHSDLDSHAPAARATSSGGVSYQWPVANTDTARFEGYGFLASVGMVDLAYEELQDALEAGDLDEIKPALLTDVAGRLLNAADQAQRSLVGRTDRGAMSHTRARGCVRTALRKHPVRAGLSEVDLWAAEVTKTTTRLLAIAAKL